MAGVFSGLTLGLLSLDMLQLEVLAKGGHPHEQKYAKGLIPLVHHHHLLLVTLLLANAGVMEALPYGNFDIVYALLLLARVRSFTATTTCWSRCCLPTPCRNRVGAVIVVWRCLATHGAG